MDYREILESVADGVYFVDRERRITYWNRAAAEISGHRSEDVLGTLCPDGGLRHVDADGRLLCHDGCPLTAVLRDGQPREELAFLRHRAGHRVPVRVVVRPLRGETGEIVGAVETFTDVSSEIELRRRSAELERLAFIDELTGLGNRRFAEHQLESALAEQTRHGRRFGLLMADVDHFKAINDAHGHPVGDTVLRDIARHLSEHARTVDRVARIGGEEFGLILVQMDRAGALAVAENLCAAVRSTAVHVADGQPFVVTLSAGVASLPCDGPTAAALITAADKALYAAKSAGRDRVAAAGGRSKGGAGLSPSR
jgi:diguanylate cyclase (GGDEF)-like protein/PAS domain S-box-containing protein